MEKNGIIFIYKWPYCCCYSVWFGSTTVKSSLNRYLSTDFWVKMLRNLFLLFVIWGATEGRRRITVKNCGIRDEAMGRIIGGNETSHGSYPWMVTIHEKIFGFDHACGGSIINEHWIVTAAHCIYFPKKPWLYVIYAGLHELSDTSHEAAKRHKISKIIMHRHYNKTTAQNDIALLKTEIPMDIKGSKGYVNGVCLPRTKTDPEGSAIVTGWGHTIERGKNSDVLKAVRVPIISRQNCNMAYDINPYDDEDKIRDTMICAGGFGKDSCQNDSGGPLVQKNKNGAFTLIGIVSYGNGCGRQRYPGVYTKVASYMRWITRNIGK